MGRRNIIGFAYGLPSRKGKRVYETAAVMYVVKKVPPEQVEGEYLGSYLVESVFGPDIKSDVDEMGVFRLLAGRTRQPAEN